jgi:hypothetical protein
MDQKIRSHSLRQFLAAVESNDNSVRPRTNILTAIRSRLNVNSDHRISPVQFLNLLSTGIISITGITNITNLSDLISPIRMFSRETLNHSNNNNSNNHIESKMAYLKTLTFSDSNEDPDSKMCGICYVDFTEAQHIVQTTCCGTKFMHLNCGIQCLRRSEICPFCKSCKIGFLE